MSRLNIYEYMHNLPVVGGTPGIDAITLTALGLEGKLSISYIMNELREKMEVEEPKPFSFNGAKGWARGSIRYAEKYNELHQKQWAILMVTGEDSGKILRQSLLYSDIKYTRVDLCVDIEMSERVLGLARKLKDGYKGKSQVKLIESLTGDTFYCGSRNSESYIRIYDKSEFYGREAGHVWRFEVEFKGGLATLVPDLVAEVGSDGIKDIIFQECRHKDLPSPVPGKVVNLKRKMVTMSSSEMKLNWLKSQVRPTVSWLSKLGMKEQVMDALQLNLPSC